VAKQQMHGTQVDLELPRPLGLVLQHRRTTEAGGLAGSLRSTRRVADPRVLR
jgi:hypothetical protein